MKSVPSGGTRVEVKKLWQEEAILNFEVQKLFFTGEAATEGSADRTAQNDSRLVVW